MALHHWWNGVKTMAWSYRIRLKGNLIFAPPGQYHLTCVIISKSTLCQVILGGEITGRDAAALGVKVLNGAGFNATEVKTNIGILQDPGYDEPWIIAMDCPASEYKTLD